MDFCVCPEPKPWVRRNDRALDCMIVYWKNVGKCLTVDLVIV